MDIPVTNIIFFNAEGNVDETQFDTQSKSELAELWWDFCIGEGIILAVTKGMADYETGIMRR